MRSLMWIGMKEITVDALQGTREEKWLYFPMDDLIVMKEKYDAQVTTYHKSAMDNVNYPFEQECPDPNAIYEVALQNSMFIAAIIIYKNTNNYRSNLECGVEKNKKNRLKAQFILEMVRKNPRVTYFDIINAKDTEEELEKTLEVLIERRVLSWKPQRGRYHEEFDGWIINTKAIEEL